MLISFFIFFFLVKLLAFFNVAFHRLRSSFSIKLLMLWVLMWSHGSQIILIDNLRLEDLAVVEIAIVISHMVIPSVCKSVEIIHRRLLITIYKVFRSYVVCTTHHILVHEWVFLRLISNLILVVYMLLHNGLLLGIIQFMRSIIVTTWMNSWLILWIFRLIFYIW